MAAIYETSYSIMIGGGFLGQMMDTMKYNRDLLKKKKRKPFDKTGYIGNSSNADLVDNKQISEKDRENIFQSIKRDKEKDKIKRIVILIISITLTLALFWTLINLVTK